MNEITKLMITEGINFILTNDAASRFLCGTYSDGSTRSFSDCLRGEFLSPKDKAKKAKKKDKKKKNKKGKKNK